MLDARNGDLTELVDTSSAPLVSVVTPVFNGASYLAQCIDSVLAQTYQNWQYIIVDNYSTDGSREIATSYAERDPRISVLCNREHLGPVANWNYSVSQISPISKYCKILHADDWLFPECLAKMVELAESNPSVSIVSCYILAGSTVLNGELPYPSYVVSGRRVARGLLLREFDLQCTPTSQLIRVESIRGRRVLYDESPGIVYGIDRQLCLELLEDTDFGFVHQVLVFTRVHSGSLSSKIDEYSVNYPEAVRFLRRFGRMYLTDEEYQFCWNRETLTYSRFLGRSLFAFRGAEFWRYHKQQVLRLGLPMNSVRIGMDALKEAIRIFGGPVARVVEQCRRSRGGSKSIVR